MRTEYYVGVDIGSSFVRTVVLSATTGSSFKIAGNSVVLAKGVQKGHIVSPKDFSVCLKEAFAKASVDAGNIKIKKAHVAVGSIGLSSSILSGSTIVGRTDKLITRLDVEKAYQVGISKWKDNNKNVLHKIPISFKIDGKEIEIDPVGMTGSKLEIKFLVITILSQYLEKLLESFHRTGVEIETVVASPLAGSIMVLSEREAMAGALLLDIGSQNSNLAVFENGSPITVFSLPIGGNSISEDIALTLKLDLETAEGIKIGTHIPNHPRRMVDEIIEARCEDIYELINKELKRIGRNGLLPAGVTIIGGGSRLTGIVDTTKKSLGLPAKIGYLNTQFENSIKLKDNTWFNAIGVVLYSISDGDDSAKHSDTYKNDSKKVSMLHVLKSIFKQFLPIFFFLISAKIDLL